MINLLVLTACANPLNSFAQRYNPDDILEKADSVIISHVGQRIFDKYYKRSPTNLYDYKTRKNAKKVKWSTLSEYGKIKKNPTKGYFQGAFISYTITIKEKDFTCWSDENVKFDADFNVEWPIDTAMIPQYVWRNDTCDFIPKSKALEIAERCFNGKGRYSHIDIRYGKYSYRYPYHGYFWEVRKLLWYNRNKEEPFGYEKVVLIDAASGEIVKCEEEELKDTPELYYLDEIYGY